MKTAKRRFRLVLVILWTGVVSVVTLSLLPQVTPPSAFFADKGLHVTAYFALAVLAVLSFPNRRTAIVAALSIAAVGVFVEFAQYAVPGRSPWLGESIDDVIANGVGILAGIAVGFRARSRFLKTPPSVPTRS